MPINVIEVLILALVALFIILIILGGVVKDIFPFMQLWGNQPALVSLNSGVGGAACNKGTLIYGVRNFWDRVVEKRVDQYYYAVVIQKLDVEPGGNGNADVLPVLFFKESAATPVGNVKSFKVSNLPGELDYQLASFKGPSRDSNGVPQKESATINFFEGNEHCYDIGQSWVSDSDFIQRCGTNILGSVKVEVAPISDCETTAGVTPMNCEAVGSVFGMTACQKAENCFWDSGYQCAKCDIDAGTACSEVDASQCECLPSRCYSKIEGSFLPSVKCVDCQAAVKCEDFGASSCAKNACVQNCYWSNGPTRGCKTCPSDFRCDMLDDKQWCESGVCGTECKWEKNNCVPV